VKRAAAGSFEPMENSLVLMPPVQVLYAKTRRFHSKMLTFDGRAAARAAWHISLPALPPVIQAETKIAIIRMKPARKAASIAYEPSFCTLYRLASASNWVGYHDSGLRSLAASSWFFA